MKNIFYLLVLSLIFISCETEDMEDVSEAEHVEAVVLKRGISNTTILSKQEHVAMLDWNSYIIGQLMLYSPAAKQLVLNSLNPVSKTVSMNLLLNSASNTAFLDHYIYVATHARMIPEICGNPDSTPWPPRGGPGDFGIERYIEPNISKLINDLTSHKTELYIPNSIANGDVHTAGHPLEDVSYNRGINNYKIPMGYVVLGVPCVQFYYYLNISQTERADNYSIILSRPNLSTGNPFPYINFNITFYLRGPVVTRSGSTNLNL
jgi:hypothetical protein